MTYEPQSMQQEKKASPELSMKNSCEAGRRKPYDHTESGKSTSEIPALEELLFHEDTELELDDDDDEDSPWVDEFELLRKTFIKECRDSIHCVDLAFAQEPEDYTQKEIPLETVRTLQEAMNAIDSGRVIFNFFYDRKSRQPHALIISHLSEYKVLSALSDTKLTFSLTPAFLAANEDEIDYLLYYYMAAKCDAVPVTIY